MLKRLVTSRKATSGQLFDEKQKSNNQYKYAFRRIKSRSKLHQAKSLFNAALALFTATLTGDVQFGFKKIVGQVMPPGLLKESCSTTLSMIPAQIQLSLTAQRNLIYPNMTFSLIGFYPDYLLLLSDSVRRNKKLG